MLIQFSGLPTTQAARFTKPQKSALQHAMNASRFSPPKFQGGRVSRQEVEKLLGDRVALQEEAFQNTDRVARSLTRIFKSENLQNPLVGAVPISPFCFVKSTGEVSGSPFIEPYHTLAIECSEQPSFLPEHSDEPPSFEAYKAAIERNSLLKKAFTFESSAFTPSKMGEIKGEVLKFMFDASAIPELSGVTPNIFNGYFVRD